MDVLKGLYTFYFYLFVSVTSLSLSDFGVYFFFYKWMQDLHHATLGFWCKRQPSSFSFMEHTTFLLFSQIIVLLLLLDVFVLHFCWIIQLLINAALTKVCMFNVPLFNFWGGMLHFKQTYFSFYWIENCRWFWKHWSIFGGKKGKVQT